MNEYTTKKDEQIALPSVMLEEMVTHIEKPDELVIILYEALDGAMPNRCRCSEDQLQDACGCGYELAQDALEKSRGHYRKLIR